MVFLNEWIAKKVAQMMLHKEREGNTQPEEPEGNYNQLQRLGRVALKAGYDRRVFQFPAGAN